MCAAWRQTLTSVRKRWPPKQQLQHTHTHNNYSTHTTTTHTQQQQLFKATTTAAKASKQTTNKQTKQSNNNKNLPRPGVERILAAFRQCAEPQTCPLWTAVEFSFGYVLSPFCSCCARSQPSVTNTVNYLQPFHVQYVDTWALPRSVMADWVSLAVLHWVVSRFLACPFSRCVARKT